MHFSVLTAIYALVAISSADASAIDTSLVKKAAYAVVGKADGFATGTTGGGSAVPAVRVSFKAWENSTDWIPRFRRILSSSGAGWETKPHVSLSSIKSMYLSTAHFQTSKANIYRPDTTSSVPKDPKQSPAAVQPQTPAAAKAKTPYPSEPGATPTPP